MHRSIHRLMTLALCGAFLAPSSASGQTRPAEADRKPLAVVFGAPLHAHEIDEMVREHKEARAEPFANADEEAQWETEQRQTRFVEEVDSRLMLQYMMRDPNLMPTPDEIWEVLQAWWRQSHAQLREEQERVRAQLAAAEPGDPERAALEKRAAGIERRLAEGKKFEKPLAELTPQERGSIDTAGGIANGTVMFWKFNKSMHHKYGGDVVILPEADDTPRMFGPQAVEAVARWVHELRDNKDLIIHDQELAKAFFEETHPLDHPEAVPAPEGAFEQPPWREKP